MLRQDLDSFSRRNQYSEAKEITVREDAPEPLRVMVLVGMRETRWKLPKLQNLLYRFLRVRSYPNRYANPWDELQDMIYDCKWFKVYDLIEALYAQWVVEEFAEFDPFSDAWSSSRFADEINNVFLEEGIGWQLVKGQVVTRGDDTFENVVHTAEEELISAGRTTAAGRIKKAVQNLSARPQPDTSGAISHGTGAMECVLHDITGQEMTLGEYLNRHRDLFPGSIQKALHGLWGFSSHEGARHGREGTEPSREDAEFIVAISAAVTTYLTRKHPRS